LQELRQAIKESAPEAKEVISYQMPAFKLNGNLVYFAAWKNHIGFYGGSSSTIDGFREELSDFEVSKGTIKFPMDMPLPIEIVKKIVARRVKENLDKNKTKYS
jgi:uncharacterized protein YdhG (YjbR/CyaY superfamily)